MEDYVSVRSDRRHEPELLAVDLNDPLVERNLLSISTGTRFET